MEKSKGSKGNQYTEKLDRFHDGTSPTLRDLGIHKKQSQRWQQIAAELGVSQKTVSNDLVINSVRTEKTTKQPRTYSRYTINQGLVQRGHHVHVDFSIPKSFSFKELLSS